MSVTVGVPTESAPGERRVALVPGAMTVLAKTGAELVVEQGAGDAPGIRTPNTPRRARAWPRAKKSSRPK